MQSIPFGSSLLYTKQLKASLKFSPQGPDAIPPRHGQSQLISPVSGLNAPCCPASSSSEAGSCEGVSLPSGGGPAPSDTPAARSPTSIAELGDVAAASTSFNFCRSAARDSRVWTGVLGF